MGGRLELTNKPTNMEEAGKTDELQFQHTEKEW